MSIVGEQQNDDDDGGPNAVDTMTSIAKCGSTLELHTPPEGFSAVPFLVKMLGVYDREVSDGNPDVDMADDTDNTDGDKDATTTAAINALFADIPVSKAQCEQSWTELCAFVSRNVCWRPSPKCKVDVWKRVVEGSVLQGINLEEQFLVNDLWKSVLDEDDDNGGEPFPRGLFEAVVRRVCESESGIGGSNVKCGFPCLPYSREWLLITVLIKGRISTNLGVYNGSARRTYKPWLLHQGLQSAAVSSSMRGRIICQSLGGMRWRFPSYLYAPPISQVDCCC